MGGAGANSGKERCIVHCPELDQIVIGVPDMKKAIEVAKELNMPIDLVGGSFVDDPNYLEQIKNICDGDKVKNAERKSDDDWSEWEGWSAHRQ